MTARRTAVVTGAAGGIGAAIAERLAKDGFLTVIVDVKPADAVLERITDNGGEARYIECDITDARAVAELANEIEKDLAGCSVLVHCAGRYDFTPLESTEPALWRKIMALNVDSMFFLSQQLIPSMRRNGWGRIICLASNSCIAPPPAASAYVGSKSAVIGCVRSLAGELGSAGITVNAVAPGPIETEQLRRSFYASQGGDEDPTVFDAFMEQFTAQQAVPRPGSPEDVAAAVAFFASEESGFISGQTLVVDGGYAKH